MKDALDLYADPETLRKRAARIEFLPQDSPELPAREAALRDRLEPVLREAVACERIVAGDLNAIVR